PGCHPGDHAGAGGVLAMGVETSIGEPGLAGDSGAGARHRWQVRRSAPSAPHFAALAQGLRDAELVIFVNGSRMAFIEERKAYIRVVEGILGRVETGAAGWMIYGACPNPSAGITARQGRPAASPQPGYAVRRNCWPATSTCPSATSQASASN